mgnify:CR=1 FL=1
MTNHTFWRIYLACQTLIIAMPFAGMGYLVGLVYYGFRSGLNSAREQMFEQPIVAYVDMHMQEGRKE